MSVTDFQSKEWLDESAAAGEIPITYHPPQPGWNGEYSSNLISGGLGSKKLLQSFLFPPYV